LEPKEEKKSTGFWSQDDISKLSKGIGKYPGAIQGRWQLITDFVETKTLKEVIAKATELS
jgi:DnaJ family protein C protein 2